MKKILFIIVLYFCTNFLFGQTIPKQDIKTGTYGIYWDWSTYTELTINANLTFSYLVRDFQGNKSTECEGKWKVKKRKLFLICRDKILYQRPIPIKWKIKENELCLSRRDFLKGWCLELQKEKE